MAYSTQTIVIGNSTDININPHSCESEIRADVRVAEFTSVRLWGQILNCKGEPVPNAMVKLVKILGDVCDKSYEGIAHTKSDCDGFYQFDICSDENAWYKVLVGKSNTGKEIIVSATNRSCPSCTPEDFHDDTLHYNTDTNNPLPYEECNYPHDDPMYCNSAHYTSDCFIQDGPSYTTPSSPFNFSTPKDCHSK